MWYIIAGIFIMALIVIYKARKKLSLDDDFDVIVKYDEKLEAKVGRLMKHGLTFASENITSANLPVPEGRRGTVTMRIALPKLKQAMSIEDAKKFVGQRNLEVGDPYQLLDFIEHYWDRLQEQMAAGFMVAALRTFLLQSRNGRHYVVCFRCDGSNRRLDFLWVEAGWNDRWRLFCAHSVLNTNT